MNKVRIFRLSEFTGNRNAMEDAINDLLEKFETNHCHLEDIQFSNDSVLIWYYE